MAHGRWVGIALATAALLSSAPAAADHVVTVGEVTVEFRDSKGKEPAQVVARGADDGELWTISHGDPIFGFPEPLVVDGRLLYSVYGDLLELDVAQGQVANRWRFPGRILELEPGDAPSVVRVTVNDKAGTAWRDTEATLRFRLGDAAPGRSPWGLLVPTRSMEAARWIAAATGQSYSAEEVAEGLRVAEEQAHRDPTNPFLTYVVGRWLSLSDREGDAHAMFMRAAQSQLAPWSDMFHVAAKLQAHDAEAARAAFENGYDRMVAAGVRPERLQSLIANNVLFGRDAADNQRAALAGADVELAHELATRRWKVLPKLEGGPAYWRALAAWFEDQERDDLGETWRERAASAEDGWLNRVDLRTGAAVDLAAPIVAGMFFGVVFGAFLAGLRLRRRTSWRAPAAAVATVVVPLVLAMLFAATPSAWLWRGNQMLFPDDTFGAPSVVASLEASSASPARDEVLEWARAESTAVLAGQRNDGAMPDEATIAEAIMPTPSWWEGVQNADEAISHVLPDWHVVSPAYVDHWFEFLLVLLVPLIIGLAIGRFTPTAARWLQRTIPGGATKLSIAGGAVFGVFAASVLVLVGGYTSYWADDGAWSRVLGLDEIWRDVSPGPSLWWYVPLIAIPLIQGVLAWREVRSRR